MKTIGALLLCCLCGYTSAAQKLITDSYEVTIDVRCGEGEVTCDKVGYTGVNRKTGKGITLIGSTVHSLCADRVTPCRFLGYVFKNGKVTYSVDEAGQLRVTQGRNVLLEESGVWQ